jgi:CRP-like cAMP-binding protein
MGDTFWVTLKGSVGVNLKLDRVVGVDKQGNNIMEKVLTEVRVLPAGSSFGELALLNRAPRAATITCKEDCEFAVLGKTHFDSILSKISELC